MSRRMIDLCLLAYPAATRRRDGGHLRELALDLAEDHGLFREVCGLLRGGLAERRRRSRSGRAVVAVGAASLLALTALTALTWTATAQSAQIEEDVFECAGECTDARAEVASRVRDGWSCTERPEPDRVSWRCVLD